MSVIPHASIEIFKLRRLGPNGNVLRRMFTKQNLNRSWNDLAGFGTTLNTFCITITQVNLTSQIATSLREIKYQHTEGS